MPFAAVTYDIKPGFEDEIDEIFANFRRVGSPKIEARRDEPVGKVVATAVFIRDATMVRVTEHEGDLDAIARHVATQPGVREGEEKLGSYSAKRRETGTVKTFLGVFNRSLLRRVSQLSVHDLPVAG